MSEFTELLEKGMGTRSVSRFAADCGVSREHLTRLLKGTATSPSQETLKKLASAMTEVSLNDLLTSCGYEAETPQKHARELYKSFSLAFHELFKLPDKEFGKVLVQRSVEDFCDLLYMIYAKEDGTFEIVKTEEPKTGNAEKRSLVRYSWKLWHTKCFTYFYVEYTPGRDCVFIQKCFFAEKSPSVTGIWDEKSSTVFEPPGEKSPSERLLYAIFGDGEKAFQTFEGLGFYLKDVSKEAAAKYICENKDVFLKKKKNREIFGKMNEPDADLEKVFEKYGEAGDIFEAVADIMSEKAGVLFDYWMKDSGFEKDESCILFDHENVEKKSDITFKIIYVVFDAAKSLGIGRFGTVKHTAVMDFIKWHDYDTKTFYIVAKEKEEKE